MVEVIVIGNELLSGAVVDTNSAWLFARLYERGIRARRKTLVLDEKGDIVSALREAASRARLVVCSGGLGPTADDITAAAGAEAASVPVVLDPEAKRLVTEAVRARGAEVSAYQLEQARVPEGARILPNPRGTAPGFALQLGACTAFFLPGPPREFQAMAEAWVLPFAGAEGLAGGSFAAETLRLFGLGESRVAEIVETSGADLEGVEVGYRVAFPEVHLRLRASGATGEAARARVEAAAAGLEAAFGPVAFARNETSFPACLGALLAGAGATLALAESCTGGLASALLTDVPGSSRYLLLSAVTYANEMKTRVLGVPAEVLATEGAVSEACARAMAEGALSVSGADHAVSITGIAGPEGGSEEKPVGTVCFALAGAGRDTVATRQHFFGDRGRVRRRAAFFALDLVRRRLLDVEEAVR